MKNWKSMGSSLGFGLFFLFAGSASGEDSALFQYAAPPALFKSQGVYTERFPDGQDQVVGIQPDGSLTVSHSQNLDHILNEYAQWKQNWETGAVPIPDEGTQEKVLRVLAHYRSGFQPAEASAGVAETGGVSQQIPQAEGQEATPVHVGLPNFQHTRLFDPPPIKKPNLIGRLLGKGRPQVQNASLSRSAGAATTRGTTSIQGLNLIPPNYRNNPGFSFASHWVTRNGIRKLGKCAATLISAANGVCLAATAAHCLMDALGSRGKFDRTLHALIGTALITTPMDGDVSATLFVNPNYLQKGQGGELEDAGVFAWKCSNVGDTQVLPISDTPLRNKEQVVYGKVMSGKAGAYYGRVYREPRVAGINGRPVGDSWESIVQPSGATIEQGDSGGGLYRMTPSGHYELVGVLSASDDTRRNWSLGNYATNRTLEFFRRMYDAFGGGHEKTSTEDTPQYATSAGASNGLATQ